MKSLRKHETMSSTAFARGVAGAIDKVRVTGCVLDITKGKEVIAQLIPPEKKGFPVEQLFSLINHLPHLGKEESLRFAQDLKKVRNDLELPGDLWE